MKVIKLSDEAHKKLKVMASECGSSMKELIEAIIFSWLDEDKTNNDLILLSRDMRDEMSKRGISIDSPLEIKMDIRKDNHE